MGNCAVKCYECIFNRKSPLEEQLLIPESPTYKLLLLGAGESGKTTIFKQVKLKYGVPYNAEQKKEFIESIHENVIESMQTLIVESEKAEEKQYQMAKSCDSAAKLILELENTSSISKRVAEAITKLWQDEGIRRTFARRSRFQVPDTVSYFFHRVNSIAAKDYVPSEMDLLRVRDRTTGIYSETVEALDARFQVFDVGGQRAERKKWENVLKDLKAVLFVVAISEYDQVCFEDEITNRLEESVSVFEKFINSKHLQNIPVVLIFNKIDLFKQKLENNIPFRFDGYQGPPTDYDAITAFVQELFEGKHYGNREVAGMFMSALDDGFDHMNLFEAVLDFYRPPREE